MTNIEERLNLLYTGGVMTGKIDLHTDYSGFEGRQLQGRPSLVTMRGQVAVRDGAFVGTLGHGKFLHREPTHF